MRTALLLVVFAACKTSSTDPKDTTIEWRGQEFRVDGYPIGDVSLDGGVLEVKVRSGAWGQIATLELGEPPKSVTFKPGEKGMFPVWSRMGDALLAKGSKSTVDLQLPMKISWTKNDQPSLTTIGKVDVVMGDAAEAFKSVAESKRPREFGDEPATTGPKTIAFPSLRPDDKGAFVGPGKRLRDVDLVGAVHIADKGTDLECSYNGLGSVTVTFRDAVVTLYDRRTAKVVDTVTVPLEREAKCPYAINTEGGVPSGSSFWPSIADVALWFEHHR